MDNLDYLEAHEHISRNMLDSFSKPIALMAIEKQIPVKIYNDTCRCGALLHPYDKFCFSCGQALDWSEYDY